MKAQETICKLHDQDYVNWLEITIKQLRSQNIENVDWGNLIEEIEDLGREQRNKVESFLSIYCCMSIGKLKKLAVQMDVLTKLITLEPS